MGRELLSDILTVGNNGNDYLPTGIGVAVVEKVLLDPLVNGRQRHFVLVGFHGHANERSVRIGRFDIADCFVIDFFFFFFGRRTGR